MSKAERIQKICNPYEIRTVFTSGSTLRRYLFRVKPPTEFNMTKNCVYSIPCSCGRIYNGLNKECSSNFRECSRVGQTPEEGRRIYRPKRYENNNKDEDNSSKTLNDKNQQASSEKFRKLRFLEVDKRKLCKI